jgi:hypothetical protein
MPDSSSLSSLLPKENIDQDYAESTTRLRIRDYTEKLDSRESMKWILIALLLLQNAAVYGLVGWALYAGKLADLQVVIGIVISATLGETYLMVRIMIEWLFKDIDYK